MQKIDRKQSVYWRAKESNFQENIEHFEYSGGMKENMEYILLCYSMSWTYYEHVNFWLTSKQIFFKWLYLLKVRRI